MTNRSQDNELRSVIFHWSFFIGHFSFAKSPAMPCDRSTEGQDLSSGPKRLRKAYSQRSTPKATQPEKAASPFLRMSKVSPKKFRWKLIDPIASAPPKTISVLTGSSFCARNFGLRDGSKNGSVAFSHATGRPMSERKRSIRAR